MSAVLSVDPGIRGCGCAFFVDDKLICAEYVKNPEAKGNGPEACKAMALQVVCWTAQFKINQINQLALEWPQTYHGRSAKGDTNDLFALAGVQSAIAALLPLANATHYVPQAWKGQLPKPKHGEPYIVGMRVTKRLQPDERECVRLPKVKKLQLDVWDACGIGLHHLRNVSPC